RGVAGPERGDDELRLRPPDVDDAGDALGEALHADRAERRLLADLELELAAVVLRGGGGGEREEAGQREGEGGPAETDVTHARPHSTRVGTLGASVCGWRRWICARRVGSMMSAVVVSGAFSMTAMSSGLRRASVSRPCSCASASTAACS